MRHQSGQSLVEFAVGASALTLLMLGSITVAGYQEGQRRTAITARELVFAGSWLRGAPDLDAQLVRTALQEVNEPGHPQTPAGSVEVGTSGIDVPIAEQRAPGLAGTSADVMLAPLKVAGGFLGGGFDIAAGRYTTGTLTVRLEEQPDLPAPFSGLSLTFQQPFALQADAWNSDGIDQVRSRTQGLVPSAALRGLQSIWRPLLAPLALIEPSLGDLCLGLIEPDRIPEDRLGAGSTPLPRGCR